MYKISRYVGARCTNQLQNQSFKKTEEAREMAHDNYGQIGGRSGEGVTCFFFYINIIIFYGKQHFPYFTRPPTTY